MVSVLYRVAHMLTTVSARGAAATGGTAGPKFGTGMHEFDAGRLVWYACYIRLFTCLLQVVHEVQLLQEVQLYQNLVQECMNLMQEDLYGMRVI